MQEQTMRDQASMIEHLGKQVQTQITKEVKKVTAHL